MEHPPEATPHDHSHGHGDRHGHDASHDAAHVQAHVKGYLFVGGLLVACTILTVALSYVNFGTQKANIIVAMIVATFKVGCVAAVFMHLKSERWTIYRILLITIVFAFGLFFLTGLAMFDPIHLN
jgi:caa(3)-type oxidase subunit IV